MIVDYEELPQYKKRVVLVDGAFDPVHVGHVKYLEAAAALGLPVFCNIQSDRYIIDVKQRPNLLPEEQRVALLNSVKYVSYVHLCNTSTGDVLERLDPVMYVKGNDWRERGLPGTEQMICKRQGIDIVYLDTKVDASTNVVDIFLKKALTKNYSDTVGRFEEYYFSQNGVDTSSYDKEYFQGNWRANSDNYSLEKRRTIEAKNPENIRRVFNPKRVLDVGCGPGALMLFLQELGIECYGIDISDAAKAIASPEVKDRIVTSSASEYRDFGVDFDLVICREFLEHLTIRQVHDVVRALAQYTSKYLYVTTRYHQSPLGLLDVSDDLETDPTHITTLNKEFLRLLFVLEGLKSRPDLENAMDWKGLGRVLVFEKVRK